MHSILFADTRRPQLRSGEEPLLDGSHIRRVHSNFRLFDVADIQLTLVSP